MNLKNKSPPQRTLQGPDLSISQISVTDSNCWQSPLGEKEARPMPLYIALSENSREIDGKNPKIISFAMHSFKKYLLNTYHMSDSVLEVVNKAVNK